MELMLWLSLSWEEGILAFKYQVLKAALPIGWVKLFCIITGTFSKNRCQKERVILHLGQTIRTETLLCLYQFYPLFQLCTLSHAEVISSHSHFEWPAACVSLWWGRLPVSCQLILPTSFHLPPDVAPICESPAVPKKKRQQEEKEVRFTATC